MQFAPKWLAAPVDLRPMPIMGQSEVKRIEKEGAEAISVGHLEIVVRFHQLVIATEKMVKAYGAAKMKPIWDSEAHLLLAPLGNPIHFTNWPVETFEESLKATKEKELYLVLNAANDEELALAMTKEAAELKARAEAVPKGALDRLATRPLLVFYWRLRATGVKEIITPAGPKAIDWSLQPDKKQAALDLLSEVLDESDIAALAPKATSRLLGMEDLKAMTAADVEGKSSPTSEPSTPSRPASAPSLETTDGLGSTAATGPQLSPLASG